MMPGDNNAKAGNLPKSPHPELKKLECLIGTWELSGEATGGMTYEWMEGGFFFVHRFELNQGGQQKGIEYVGFDEDSQTLRSHLMGTDGANFTYTWELNDAKLTIWFGEKGSEIVMHAELAADGNSYTGQWQGPGPDGEIGGYSFKATRVGS